MTIMPMAVSWARIAGCSNSYLRDGLGGDDEGMTKAPKKNARKSEIELRPDGWERFGKAVDAAVKSGPKHRPAKPVKKVRKARKSNG
jgi:hypothetical protein